MKVTLYPATKPSKNVDVKTFMDIRRLIGGHVVIASSTPLGEILVNEDGIPLNLTPNQHYQGLLGNVVFAPKNWKNLPYE